MATVSQVLKASLGMIQEQASEAPIEPEEAQDFVFAMNNYMLALNAEGIQLGYTEVSDLGDTVTIPTGALRGLIANMAIEMAPTFDIGITTELMKQARDGYQTMLLLGVNVPTTNYPSTLPIGSGSEQGYGCDSHFYDQDEAAILAETTGTISQETNTEDS